MTLQLVKDPVLEKIQKHFEHLGIQSSVSNEKLDFESGYVDSYMMEGKNGICTVGSLKLYNSSIDYLHLVKKQEYAKCDFAVGGQRACNRTVYET